MHAPESFLLATCQIGAENAFKAELARRRPAAASLPIRGPAF